MEEKHDSEQKQGNRKDGEGVAERQPEQAAGAAAAAQREAAAQARAGEGPDPGGYGRPTGGPEEPGTGHRQWAGQPLPPGYLFDPVSGQVVFTGYVAPQPVHPGYSFQGQPLYYQGYQGETPEQIAARQAEAQQRHGQIMRSFEQFVEGDATISDVVRTLYANTAHNEQLWKGVLVGAAAAVLLTSKPARDALGKTFVNLFGGTQDGRKTPTDHEENEQ